MIHWGSWHHEPPPHTLNTRFPAPHDFMTLFGAASQRTFSWFREFMRVHSPLTKSVLTQSLCCSCLWTWSWQCVVFQKRTRRWLFRWLKICALLYDIAFVIVQSQLIILYLAGVGLRNSPKGCWHSVLFPFQSFDKIAVSILFSCTHTQEVVQILWKMSFIFLSLDYPISVHLVDLTQ